MNTQNVEKQKDMSNELATAPVGRLLVKLAIPTVVAQFVNLLYNIVDRIYIGHMENIGDIALTGIGLCFPIICLIGAFTCLVAQGGAPRAAISMGENDNARAEKILGNCFSTLIALAVILTVLFVLFGEKLLWLFGASDNTIIYAAPYMKIYAAGSIFVMLSLGLNMFITTQGFTRFGMFTVLAGAACNIILDPIFIYVFDMGVEGAALATIISQALSASLVLSFLFGKKTTLRIRRANLLPDLKILAPVFALGLAPFVMQSTEALVNIAYNSSLQKYGGDVAVGAMTIASTILQMIWLPSQGIGQGAQPIMSFNYGAHNPERVKKTFRVMLIACCAYKVVLCGLIELFPQFFIGIFNNSPELLETATWTLRVYLAMMALMGVQTAIQQTLMAIGMAKSSLFIACMRKLVLILPLIYILPTFIDNKVLAVFLAEPISDFISVAVATTLFAKVFDKEMKKISDNPLKQ